MIRQWTMYKNGNMMKLVSTHTNTYTNTHNKTKTTESTKKIQNLKWYKKFEKERKRTKWNSKRAKNGHLDTTRLANWCAQLHLFVGWHSILCHVLYECLKEHAIKFILSIHRERVCFIALRMLNEWKKIRKEEGVREWQFQSSWMWCVYVYVKLKRGIGRIVVGVAKKNIRKNSTTATADNNIHYNNHE